MVPVSTQIAIVNPETCRLCHIGEYGDLGAIRGLREQLLRFERRLRCREV
jgi:hypothetical protein